MGMRPALCKVRKFTRKERDDSFNYETNKDQRIYCINLLNEGYADSLYHYPGAHYEKQLLMNKFHKFIVYEDFIYTDYTKLKKRILKDYPWSDCFIVGETIDLEDDNNSELYVEIPKSPDKPLNYMQNEYLNSLVTDVGWRMRGIRIKRCKEITVKESKDNYTEYTVKCPVIYYQEIDWFSFGFSSFKKNRPKWFCEYGYIITNSILKLFLDYLKKRDAGYKELKAIADRGGLKDDELIDMCW